MAGHSRVTVTLPSELVRDIDQFEKNRSRFVLEAVKRELARRKRAELRRSLAEPHPQTAVIADEGLDAWASSLPREPDALVDRKGGVRVRWRPGRGWERLER
jgi:hypothetical protein